MAMSALSSQATQNSVKQQETDTENEKKGEAVKKFEELLQEIR